MPGPAPCPAYMCGGFLQTDNVLQGLDGQWQRQADASDEDVQHRGRVTVCHGTCVELRS